MYLQVGKRKSGGAGDSVKGGGSCVVELTRDTAEPHVTNLSLGTCNSEAFMYFLIVSFHG